jgi:hypothetical protein
MQEPPNSKLRNLKILYHLYGIDNKIDKKSISVEKYQIPIVKPAIKLKDEEFPQLKKFMDIEGLKAYEKKLNLWKSLQSQQRNRLSPDFPLSIEKIFKNSIICTCALYNRNKTYDNNALCPRHSRNDDSNNSFQLNDDNQSKNAEKIDNFQIKFSNKLKFNSPARMLNPNCYFPNDKSRNPFENPSFVKKSFFMHRSQKKSFKKSEKDSSKNFESKNRKIPMIEINLLHRKIDDLYIRVKQRKSPRGRPPKIHVSRVNITLDNEKNSENKGLLSGEMQKRSDLHRLSISEACSRRKSIRPVSPLSHKQYLKPRLLLKRTKNSKTFFFTTPKQ